MFAVADTLDALTNDRPYRAAMQQGLIYTRVGNPIGAAEVAEAGPDRPEPRLR